MRERKQGAIINVASTAGFQPCSLYGYLRRNQSFRVSFQTFMGENRTSGVTVVPLSGNLRNKLFRSSARNKPPARTSRLRRSRGPLR